MKTPVIIPAFDEADQIGPTLSRLDASTVEPFVVVNGDRGSSETAEVARFYTPNVFILREQGKLPAIQFALRKLYEYDADSYTNPIILTDADTKPLFPKSWGPAMSGAVVGPRACAAAGLVFFHDGPFFDSAARNMFRVYEAAKGYGKYSLKPAYGANLAVNFAGDTRLIDEVLNAPHIWPAEDRYLAHTIAGEQRRFRQVVQIGGVVLTSARFLPPLREKIGLQEEERFKSNVLYYGLRRANSVTHYFDEFKFVLRETNPDTP